MNKDHIIKLTVAVYNVTGFFPAEEPLKIFLREKANEILADSIVVFLKNPAEIVKEKRAMLCNKILRNTAVIQGYFEVAKSQRWAHSRNFSILTKEYEKLGDLIKNDFEDKNKEDKEDKTIKEKEEQGKKIKQKQEDIGEEAIRENESDFNDRCRKIMRVLEEKEKVQVQELKQVFPEVSKRTLRRDFDELLNRGLVERIGEGRDTFYKIRPFRAVLA